jgi:hypothetical protein
VAISTGMPKTTLDDPVAAIEGMLSCDDIACGRLATSSDMKFMLTS